MRGLKAKRLRRMSWTEHANGRPHALKFLKRLYPKGQRPEAWIWYPRAGRDWRGLVE